MFNGIVIGGQRLDKVIAKTHQLTAADRTSTRLHAVFSKLIIGNYFGKPNLHAFVYLNDTLSAKFRFYTVAAAVRRLPEVVAILLILKMKKS